LDKVSVVIEINEIENAIVVRFIRPEKRNSLSIEVIEALEGCIEKFADVAERIIFTGVNGYFASGADLREIAEIKGEEARQFARRGQRLMAKIKKVRSIAAINGICFGGALDLSLSCQLRIAHPQATFCHPGARIGIMTGWGGTQRLPRLVGEAAALHIFFTAEPISASAALEIGLIDLIRDDPVSAALKIEL
jgi:enoyl-CoA hydratase/carnithine racemase